MLMREIGATTRSQRSHSLRRVSGFHHFPAIRPGQVVAIDVTRADNLVYNALNGDVYSVEILVAIDVATRVILALRVVPRSADGVDAGLLIYDVCRPFSLAVKGMSVENFRWVGLPEQLDMLQIAVTVGRRGLAPDFSMLQGEHPIPSVMPDAVRADNGSVFLSVLFRTILRDLGIDLLLARKGKPTDNPHIERWFETVQRGLQQIPSYKGRNTTERGRLVSEEPLLTAQELQEHLQRFIALDYHRTWHTGLVLPGEPTARLSPLEMWDAMVEATGRIDVPQRADLIYQFLPVKWATIGHAGVELRNMVYDSPVLDDYRRDVPAGFFRPADNAAPFFEDPHDLSRIWFRDPADSMVKPIEWRGANRIDAPMTAMIVSVARRRIRERGGNSVLKRGSATRQILNEIGEITKAPPEGWRKKLSAAARRVEQSRTDHDEAQRAAARAVIRDPRPNSRSATVNSDKTRCAWPNLLTET